MPSAEERLAYLEGRVQEHGATLAQMSDAVIGLRTEVATLAASLRGEMADLGRELRTEIGALRKEMTTGFRWLVGLQVLTLTALVTALAAGFFK